MWYILEILRESKRPKRQGLGIEVELHEVVKAVAFDLIFPDFFELFARYYGSTGIETTRRIVLNSPTESRNVQIQLDPSIKMVSL